MQVSFGVGGATKKILESIVTSGLPPEEILKRLDSYGIQWYVTEKGDLMIRYWQIGAEDFVPVEHIARIRESQTVPAEASALEWLSGHLREVKADYADCWIAIIDNEVVADAETLPTLLQKVNDAGIENPFVTFIPAEAIIWSTAYGQ
ncbi:MAG: hypothetical protein HY694_05035 [Deltaproteobacteria bacterium]|nr:hypothetical protein [Deltaproteobacteria bacterium]